MSRMKRFVKVCHRYQVEYHMTGWLLLSEETAALSSDGEPCWDLKMENFSQVLLQTIGFICYLVISQSCSEDVD